MKILLAEDERTYQLIENMFKLCAEGGILDVMDLTLETLFGVVRGNSAALRAEVRMVIRAEEYVLNRVACRGGAKETAHVMISSLEKTSQGRVLPLPNCLKS